MGFQLTAGYLACHRCLPSQARAGSDPGVWSALPTEILYADGSNGTVALTASELEYASETGKRARIGLETGFLANREELKFEREGKPGLPRHESSRPWIVVADTSDGARMYLVPSSRLIEMPAQLRSDGVELTSVRHWQAVQRVRIDARRLTFHDVGIDRLRSVIDDAAGHGQDQH